MYIKAKIYNWIDKSSTQVRNHVSHLQIHFVIHYLSWQEIRFNILRFLSFENKTDKQLNWAVRKILSLTCVVMGFKQENPLWPYN